MAERTVPTNLEEKSAPAHEKTRGEERHFSPPVDIYETKDGLVLIADMPGVRKDAVEISIDNDILTIKGTAEHIAPVPASISEYKLFNFFRQFQITDQLDRNGISADMKHGVLKVNLPKAEAAKPKQIRVNIA